MPGPRWLPILALTSTLALAACGSSGSSDSASDGSPPTTGTATGASDTAATAGPTVAPLDLDGVYEIGTWAGPDAPDGGGSTVEGSTAERYAEVDLDARFGALTVATDCGVQLGSFSLLADGRAGVTVAGSRPIPCDAGAEDRQRRLLDTLARIDGWSGADGRLTLTSGVGDELVLVRPAG